MLLSPTVSVLNYAFAPTPQQIIAGIESLKQQCYRYNRNSSVLLGDTIVPLPIMPRRRLSILVFNRGFQSTEYEGDRAHRNNHRRGNKSVGTVQTVINHWAEFETNLLIK